MKEVKELCKKQHDCRGCRLLCEKSGLCRMGEHPCAFDLTEPPEFSPKDIEEAKMLCRVFKVSPKTRIGRDGMSRLYIRLGDDKAFLNGDLLRGIGENGDYSFEEVLGREYFQEDTETKYVYGIGCKGYIGGSVDTPFSFPSRYDTFRDAKAVQLNIMQEERTFKEVVIFRHPKALDTPNHLISWEYIKAHEVKEENAE